MRARSRSLRTRATSAWALASCARCWLAANSAWSLTFFSSSAWRSSRFWRPSNSKAVGDKDLSDIIIDGHVFRFAACQFGQKMAGSPLGSIVRAVACFFARLTYPVHVAAWVDDLLLIMSTPEHALRPVQHAPREARVMVAARDELAAAEVSTLRRVSRVRGQAIHYGFTILFVAVAAPLSQLMHDR